MSDKSLLNKPFEHIYIEEGVKDHPMTLQVLARYESSKRIYIRHYKDVFNRKNQNFRAQSMSRSLILAKNTGNLIFKGSDMCQDHGNSRFYYATSVMNCLFDCDYCFLKGMYPTADIVIFVNLEDYASKIRDMLQEGPMYLSISYDTDLLALNKVADLLSFWTDLALKEKDLTLEIRTKASCDVFEPVPNIIYSFTLSPQKVISSYEKHTAGLNSRLQSVIKACEEGCKVRLCFDPVVYINGWEECYNSFMDEVIPQIPWDKITDISVGTFRISKEYQKGLRSSCPMSAVTEYPYINEGGYLKIDNELAAGMREIIVAGLREVKNEKYIFCDSDGSFLGDR